MKVETVKRILWWLLGFRFAVGVFRAFLPFTLPEVWRQTDTLGISLRFWLRWAVELPAAHPMIPAVLNSGDTIGVMATEFPLMNWLTAPCFFFGINAGRPLALIIQHSGIFLLVVLVSRIWKRISCCQIPMELVMLGLPLLSLGADWSGKFMPDFLALLVALAAVGLNWEGGKKVPSIFLLGLAVAIKPTAGFAVLLLMLGELPWRRHLLWVALGAGLGLAYYGLVVPYLHSLEQGPSLFWIRHDYPWIFLAEWVNDPARLLKFLLNMPFVPYSVLLILPLWVWRRFQGKPVVSGWVWGILLTQILAVASVSGAQGLTHPYYYLSTLPLITLLWLDRLLRESKPLASLLCVAMAFRLAEISVGEVKPVFKPAQNREWVAMRECYRLRALHPEFPWGKGQVFRSDVELWPFLGLCFGERQNSNSSEYGFFWRETTLPAECRSVEEGEAVRLVRCSASAPRS